ncbi:MAG: translation elongation factor Ts [Planctomycetota bacterium]
MSIPAKQVMDLRAATGMPMMKCKKALEAEDGDFEKAIERLRKEGLESAEKRSGRSTGEGLVCARVAEGAHRGVLVAVACETEPVARTPMFTEFVKRLAAQVDEQGPEGVEALLASPWIDEPGQSVENVLRGLIARIGENIRVRAIARLAVESPGHVGAYVHFNGKIGAMVALRVQSADADLTDVAKELCMHVVFQKPTVLERGEVAEDVQAKEMEIFRAQVQEDPKMANKPPQVVDKIVEGKMNAFFKQSVLTEQPWIRDDKKSVADVLKEHGATVKAFRLLQVGG